MHVAALCSKCAACFPLRCSSVPLNVRCIVWCQRLQVFLTSQYLGIAMEFASGGDMFEYVVKKNGLREEEARWFFQQLIVGLDYCHRMVRGSTSAAAEAGAVAQCLQKQKLQRQQGCKLSAVCCKGHVHSMKVAAVISEAATVNTLGERVACVYVSFVGVA
eukprot:GHRQ01015596.1.p1 GENE.GHRQ01015596.1~~GHRQ01015596.1.p1  ORF type:complete len:161 (-),score=44.52 GHRQ01015596.1:988-1470(-)